MTIPFEIYRPWRYVKTEVQTQIPANSTPVVLAEMTEAGLPNGTYLVDFQIVWEGANTTDDTEIYVEINGLVKPSLFKEFQDANNIEVENYSVVTEVTDGTLVAKIVGSLPATGVGPTLVNEAVIIAERKLEPITPPSWESLGYTGTGSPASICCNVVSGDILVAESGGTGSIFKLPGGTSAWEEIVYNNGIGAPDLSGIDVNSSNGDIIVTDDGPNAVFKLAGGTPGTWVNQNFTAALIPDSVAINSSNGDVFVADRGIGSVYLQVSGIGSWINQGFTPGSDPISVALSAVTDDLYVADILTGVFKQEGSAGPWTNKNYTGTEPGSIAVNRNNGDVYVVDIVDNEVYLQIGGNGEWIPMGYSSAVGAGANPTSVSVNGNNGEVYVCDGGLNNVFVFK